MCEGDVTRDTRQQRQPPLSTWPTSLEGPRRMAPGMVLLRGAPSTLFAWVLHKDGVSMIYGCWCYFGRNKDRGRANLLNHISECLLNTYACLGAGFHEKGAHPLSESTAFVFGYRT